MAEFQSQRSGIQMKKTRYRGNLGEWSRRSSQDNVSTRSAPRLCRDSTRDHILLPPMLGDCRTTYPSLERLNLPPFRLLGTSGPRMTVSYPSIPQVPWVYQGQPRLPHFGERRPHNRRSHHRSSGSLAKRESTPSSSKQTASTFMICAFCRSNRESHAVYSSHWLKDDDGKITCPILRRYCCKHCGATGDNAHTDSYCPKNSEITHNMKSVLTTAMSSAGRRTSRNSQK